MSAPAVIVAIQVVGTLYSAKSAIDGIREGNLLKAGIGALGAYYGVDAIGNTMAAGSKVAENAVTNEVAADVAENAVTNEVAGEVAAGAMSSNPLEVMDAGSLVSSPSVTDVAAKGLNYSMNAPDPNAQLQQGILDEGEAYKRGLIRSSDVEDPSWFDQASGFANKHKGIMEAGGMALGGGLNAYAAQANADRLQSNSDRDYRMSQEALDRVNQVPRMTRKTSRKTSRRTTRS